VEYTVGYAFELRPAWRDRLRILLGAACRVDLRLYSRDRPASGVRAQAAGSTVTFRFNGKPEPDRTLRKLDKGTILTAWAVPQHDRAHLDAHAGAADAR
jgi:hypothetical protein